MSILFSSLFSGGSSGALNLTPISLDYREYTGSTGLRVSAEDKFAAKKTASISSSSLTEVINIQGSGVFTYAALISSGSVTAPKVKITIDGVVALNATTGNTSDASGVAIIGIYNNNNTNGFNASAEGLVVFKESFVVEIAGDGANSIFFFYKRFLT